MELREGEEREGEKRRCISEHETPCPEGGNMIRGPDWRGRKKKGKKGFNKFVSLTPVREKERGGG